MSKLTISEFLCFILLVVTVAQSFHMYNTGVELKQCKADLKESKVSFHISEGWKSTKYTISNLIDSGTNYLPTKATLVSKWDGARDSVMGLEFDTKEASSKFNEVKEQVQSSANEVIERVKCIGSDTIRCKML